MFGRSKLVRLQFAQGIPGDIERFGEVTKREGPTVDLKVERSKVAEILASILDLHVVDDVSVSDPPLEQTIARVFEEGRPTHDAA
jgi:ABC-2 type transport system ATP-binding protein